MTRGTMTTHPTETEGTAKRRNNGAIYLLLFLLTMGAGLAVLKYGHRVSFFHDFDMACVRAASPSTGRLYDLDKDSNTLTSRLLTLQPDRSQKFKMIAITDDPGQVYESTPPTPLDYAVILHTLHEKGVENIVLSTQMSWDGDLGLTATALSDKLAEFQHASIPIPLTRGSTAQDFPKILRKSTIPFSNVRGNSKLLPVVNQVALPTVLSDSGNTRAGFSQIENAPEDDDTIPMICVWQEKGVIPSIELLALMAAHGVTPEQVIINCGKHIRLGLEGPVIPIGKFGEITLHQADDELQSITTTPAENLITQIEPTEKTAPEDPHIYLIHATGEKTKATNAITSERLAAIIHWSKSLPTPEPGQSTQYLRLPLWADIIIIFDIFLAAWWFAGLSRGSRHLAFALTATLCFPLLLAIMDITQHWMGLSAPLVAILAAWLIPVKQRRHTTNHQSSPNL